jgi:hypothetical protein
MKRQRNYGPSSSNSDDDSDDEFKYLSREYTRYTNKKSKIDDNNKSEKEMNFDNLFKNNNNLRIDKRQQNKNMGNRLNKILDKLNNNQNVFFENVLNDEERILVMKDLKNNDNIPRADGYPTLSKVDPSLDRFGREWLDRYIEREKMLQSHPSYNFIQLIAGKCQSRVDKVLDNQKIDELVLQNQKLYERYDMERKRVIVNSETKDKQIKILEATLDKEKSKITLINKNIKKYKTILKDGNILIESGEQSDIPLHLHNQGLLYVLNIENDFLYVDTKYFLKPDQNKSAFKDISMTIFEMKKIIRSIKQELFPNSDTSISINDKAFSNDEILNHYIEYMFLIIYKYYLNCNPLDISVSPRLQFYLRFKYLVNNKEYEFNHQYKSIKEILGNVNIGGNDDLTELDNLLNRFKTKYRFNNSEKDMLNNLISSTKLIKSFLNIPTIDLSKLNKYVKQILEEEWDFYYGLEFINLTNFIYLMSSRDDINDPNYGTLYFKMIQLIVQETFNETQLDELLTKKHFEENINKSSKISNILNHFKQSNKNTNDRIYILLLSHYFYKFFKKNETPLQTLNEYIMKVNNNNNNQYFKSVMYDFTENFSVRTKTTIFPFLVDKKIIDYMKQLYFISLNDYFYNITKILIEDDIITVSKDINDLIEKNTFNVSNDKDDYHSITTKQSDIKDLSDTIETGKNEKIDASFTRVLNDMTEKIRIDIHDISFIDFLKSLDKTYISNKLQKKRYKNLVDEKDYKYENTINKLPSKNLNINRKSINNYSFITLHLYFYLYIEYLMKKKGQIKSIIKNIVNAINSAKVIISNMTKEKIPSKSIDAQFRDSYVHPSEWRLNPINSGLLILSAPIYAAIQTSLNDIKKNPNLRDINLRVIILSGETGLNERFARLVSFHSTSQGINSAQVPYLEEQIRNNKLNLIKQVIEEINPYSFIKNYNEASSFLGTIIYNQRSYKIYDTTMHHDTTKSNIAMF